MKTENPFVEAMKGLNQATANLSKGSKVLPALTPMLLRCIKLQMDISELLLEKAGRRN